MSTQKNEHNPDGLPEMEEFRFLCIGETFQKGDEFWNRQTKQWEESWNYLSPETAPVEHSDFTYRRRITPPTGTTGSDLLSLLQQIEKHCPCGARPESLDTHPHVSGCPVEQALVIVRSGPPEGWQKYAENLAFKLGQSHRTTGSWREGETPIIDAFVKELGTLLLEHTNGEIYASDIGAWLLSQLEPLRQLERQRDAALAQVEALRRDKERFSRALERIGFFFAGTEHQRIADATIYVFRGMTIDEALRRAAIDSAQRQEGR